MANLTASREDSRKEDNLLALPIKAAAAKIYKGALVSVDATGYAKLAAPADKRVMGVAYETVDNSAGAAGALSIRVIRSGSFQFNGSGLAVTNVGDKVYVTDDNTVQVSATSTILVGVITEFTSATSVRVAITPNV